MSDLAVTPGDDGRSYWINIGPPEPIAWYRFYIVSADDDAVTIELRKFRRHEMASERPAEDEEPDDRDEDRAPNSDEGKEQIVQWAQQFTLPEWTKDLTQGANRHSNYVRYAVEWVWAMATGGSLPEG